MQLFSSLQNFPQGPSKYIFELQCEKVWWQKVQYLISALSGARWLGQCRVECLHFVQPGGRDQRQATWEIFLSLDISEGAVKCHSKLCPCCIADTDSVSDVSGQTPGARCVSHASSVSVLARCLTSVARWTGTRWHVPQSLSEQKTTCSLSSPWHLVPHPASQHQRSLNTHNLQS